MLKVSRAVLLTVAVIGPTALASPSCCTKHLLPYIPDPDEQPPETFEGEPRKIVDPTAKKPEDWDDDDDGPWEPRLINNPDFSWRARLIANPGYVPPTFLERLRSEVLKALPWVVLGILLTALFETAIARLSMIPALSTVLQRAGALMGALLGVATPLCSCGSLPVAAALVSGGVPLRTVVAFLTASQSAGLDSTAITWGLLGPTAALCRLGGAVVLAIAVGFAVPSGGKSAPANGQRPSEPASAADAGARGALTSLCCAAVRTTADVLPPMLLGVCLSAVALHCAPHLATTYHALKVVGYQPQPAIIDGAGSSMSSSGGVTVLRSVLTRLAVLGAALPLQLCEHSSVAYAAAIQKAGGAPGVAFAFLLAAPATNLPSLFLLVRTCGHGGGVAVRLAAALTAAALALSYAVDLSGVDLLVEREADEGGDAFTLPEWYVRSSPWIAAAFAVAAAVRAVEAWRRPMAMKHDACCDDAVCKSYGKAKLS